VIGTTVMVAGLLALMGCASDAPPGPGTDPTNGGTDPTAPTAPEGYSGQGITLIVPTAAGGGLDTTIRQIQPYLSAALGGLNVEVENVEGGNSALGGQRGKDDKDCTTILTTGIPHLMFSYLTQDVGQSLDDFVGLAGITIEPGVIRVANDAPWQTIQDLVDDAKARPGEITVSVSEQASANYAAMLELEKTLGVDFNVVPFGGGGPARNAVVSGEVDATHAAAFGSLAIADQSRVLAVHEPENLWPDITDDAPTLNEAFNINLGSSGAYYGLWTSVACAQDFPGRFAELEAAVLAALEDPDYITDLTALGEQDKVTPETAAEWQAHSEAMDATLKALIAEDPDTFKTQ
jgi:tripartite-type tricarboxylate transporter receptor subunit TctC